jgi:flagellar biosynthesis protein FlhF
MKAKSFAARDMKAALQAVRSELGEEALILSTHLDETGNLVLTAVADHTPDLVVEELPEAGTIESFDERHRRIVLSRVRSPQKDNLETPLPFDRDGLFEALCAERTPDMLAAALTDGAEESCFTDFTRALARALDQRMHTAPIDVTHPCAILLAGPMGAGKTNVAAKLAAEARMAGMNVRLVATDSGRAGALARLQALAEPMQVEVLSAETPDELTEHVNQAARDGVLIIADTAGFDPRAKSAWRDFLFLTRGLGEIVGVVSALTDAVEAGEMAEALLESGAERVIVTGLDGVRRRGTVVALACSGLAIAQVSQSPFVADGLTTLTPLALARDVASRASQFLPVQDRPAA